jgi:membrane protein YqaA with SNARE-associated domain
MPSSGDCVRAPDQPPAAAEAPVAAGEPWVKRLLGRLPVAPALGVAAALDASLLPNPLEPLLVAGMLTKRRRIWLIAIVATLGCMAGATLSYLAGVYLLDPVVEPLIRGLGAETSFEQAKDRFREDGLFAIFVIAMTPIPLPFAPLGAGATGMNPILAIGLVGLFRGFRYFTIATLAWYFEPALRDAVKRVSAPWMTWISLAVGVAALLYIVLR